MESLRAKFKVKSWVVSGGETSEKIELRQVRTKKIHVIWPRFQNFNEKFSFCLKDV